MGADCPWNQRKVADFLFSELTTVLKIGSIPDLGGACGMSMSW